MAKDQSKFEYGKHNMQVLQALQKKYARDYLPYFEGLAELYVRGKNKKALDEAVQKVKRVQKLLQEVVEDGQIGTEETERLYGLVDAIEKDKLYFAEEAQKVKAFQERVEKVTAETGISPEDLNVSREIVREGVRFSHKARRDAGASLRETLPSTYKVGGKIAHALGASLLGPLYPAGKVLAGFGGDVSRLSQRRRQERESRLGSALSASLRAHSGLDQFVSSRSQAPAISEFRTGLGDAHTKARTAPLREFFDKEAYKAKWTKELLASAKEGKRKRLDFFDKLSEKIRGLSGGLLPLVGKGGQIAGVGLSAAFTASKLKSLIGKLGEWGDVQTQVAAQIRKQRALQLKFMNRINALLDLKTSEMQKGTKEVSATTSTILGGMELRKQLLKTAPKTIRDPFTGEVKVLGPGEPTIVPPSDLPVPSPSDIVTPQGVPIVSPKTGPAKATPAPEMEELNKNLKSLIDQLQKSQTVSPVTRSGSRFDSGDVLLNEHANGSLTLGED
jgi:hypothetical protein